MSEANDSGTRGRRVRRCPDEVGDLVDFMGRLFLLLLVIVGPLVVLVALAMGTHVLDDDQQGLLATSRAAVTAVSPAFGVAS